MTPPLIYFMLLVAGQTPPSGDIQMESSIVEHRPIIAKLDLAVDENSEATVTWTASNGVSCIPSGSKFGLHIWAPPGDHWIKASTTVVKFERRQVFVPDAQFPTDVSKAKLETLKIFVSSQSYEFPTKTFRVVGDKGNQDEDDDDNDTKPIPPQPTPKTTALRFVVVEDQFNRKPETALTLNDRKFWDGLKSRGHSYVVYAENDVSGPARQYVNNVYAALGVTKLGVGGAALVVVDNKTGAVLEVSALPTVAEIETLIHKYTGK